MDDLEIGETDAVVNDSPSPEENQDSVTPETVEVEEKDLTDEELKEEIARLDEEIKLEEDAKEKRHKEQDKWWKQKIVKERERAKALEEGNRRTEEKLKSFESSLIEEAYSKTVDDNFGLPYFENLAKTNPDLADKLAKDKWGKKDAKELILDTKRKLADNWDEESKKLVSEEDIRASEREKIYHELSLKQADTMFGDLEEWERVEAKEYFDEIAEGKKLTPEKAQKYAEMAKFYATRNRKPEKVVVDKDRVLAEKASTWITPKSGSKEAEVWDKNAIIQQLVNAGIPRGLAEQMYS